MKPQSLLITVFTLASPFAVAQSPGASEDMEFLFARSRYAATWSYFQQQLQRDSLNSDLNYKMGICYLNSRSQKEKAMGYFRKALALQENKPQSQLTYKLLAEAACLSHHYDQAITYYEAFRKLLLEDTRTDSVMLRETERQLQLCRMGKELSELRELTSTLLHSKAGGGDKANPITDYTASYSADHSFMTITFRRPPLGKSGYHDKELFEDVALIQEDTSWTDSRDTGRVKHEATIATSIDGQLILLYRDENGDAALYVSTLLGNYWSTPEKVNRSLNLQGWEPNEYISADGNTLYFTSSREGGYGGKDIYRSVKLPNGEWSKAINLGYPINSPYDDEAPFIHPDGVTLYFSSNRQRKNAFDIFTSSLESGKWSAPVNIGYPANKALEKVSSGLASKTVLQDNKDNCLVTFINHQKHPLVLAKGYITPADGRTAPSVQITVSDNATGEITGLYQTIRSGQYAVILPGRNNNILFEAEGYLFQSENLDISETTSFYRMRKPVTLESFSENATTVLNNVFFKGNPPVLHAHSQMELHHLFRLMAANPGLVIEIGGFCLDPVKNGAGSKRKEAEVESICRQLLDNGIDKERIQTRVYPAAKKRRRKKAAAPEEAERIELKIVKINNLK